jgi:O-antigen ligase
MLGRRYFSDHESLLLAAKACVIAGLCYLPICLVEIATGPQLYALVYGYQPYRWVGAGRYLGFRPIGMMEDGNQLGIWMAVAALIAISLSIRRLTARILGLPIGWVAIGLTAITFLCQSAGSILLLLILLPLALLKRRSFLRASVALLVLGIAGFALFQMTNRIPLRVVAENNGVAHSVVTTLDRFGRHSLAWRLAREQSNMTLALRKPLLGFGQWNWWQSGDLRPWSLWLLVLGMYGLIGLAAFAALLFLPVLRTAWSSAQNSDPDDSNLRQALAAVILMIAFDALLNGAMILPYLLLAGGLTTRTASPPTLQPK